MARKTAALFDREILIQAVAEAFRKLDPLKMVKNPVMFVTEVGAVITTAGLFSRQQQETLSFGIQIAAWLWFTVLFANFAEALAEGRGKAQAEALRKTRTKTMANLRLEDGLVKEKIPAEKLRKDDIVVV